MSGDRCGNDNTRQVCCMCAHITKAYLAHSPEPLPNVNIRFRWQEVRLLWSWNRGGRELNCGREWRGSAVRYGNFKAAVEWNLLVCSWGFEFATVRQRWTFFSDFGLCISWKRIHLWLRVKRMSIDYMSVQKDSLVHHQQYLFIFIVDTYCCVSVKLQRTFSSLGSSPTTFSSISVSLSRFPTLSRFPI